MANSPTSRNDPPPIPLTLHTAGLLGQTTPYVDSSGELRPTARETRGGFRFQILRPYGSGGMGDLFVARDLELGREVIVKKIQGEAARNAEAVARFMTEAQITGLLEHPGIVPVYGFGRHEDDHVYYAMRLIQGDNLLQAIARFHDPKAPRDPARRAFELRGLLRRFLDVCNAIGYAHNRGVLHRDIKPANIMLGPFGETLVIDWGLAKIVGRPNTPGATGLQTVAPASGTPSSTQIGLTVGTPMYMSPEQAAGLHDELTPASDVFSLGVTLYQILTGKLPYVGFRNFHELLDHVKRGQIVRPRQAHRDVPRALEAVCLQAIARAPSDRYATAQALADDLEHWLADEPVAAYREPWLVRLGRYTRKRQKATGAAAAVLLTTALALGIGFLVVRWQKNATERERLSAVAARDRAETAELAAKASAEAEKEAGIKERAAAENARQAGARADRRAELTLDTLKSLFLMQQELEEKTPNTLHVREQILTTAIEGMREVAKQNDADAQQADLLQAVLLHERAVVLKITGRIDEAKKDWRSGHEILLRLAGAKPEDLILKHAVSVSWSRGGNLAQDEGDLALALESFQKSLRLNEELVKTSRDPSERYNLAAALSQVGFIYLLDHKPEEARGYLLRALELTDTLAAEKPQDEKLRHAQAVARERLVQTYLDNDLTLAREHAEKGLAIAEPLARANPKYAMDLALLLERTSAIRIELGDAGGALVAADQQVEIVSATARNNPDNPQLKFNLIIALRRRGDLFRRRENMPEARKDAQAAKLINEDLLKRDSKSLQAQVEMTLSCRDLAHIERLDGRFELAEALYSQGISELARVQRDSIRPLSPDLDNTRKNMEIWRRVCQLAPEAVKDEAFIETQKDGNLAFHLFEVRIRWFALKGQLAEAESCARKMRESFPNLRTKFEVIATAFALCARAAKDNADRDRCAMEAVAQLKKAIDSGYKSLGVLRIDARFEVLRDRADFQKLIAELEAKVRMPRP